MKQIQEEYQAYMEGVRATAQGAIDQANALFQALRQDATHTLDTAIHYLQNRFFSMQALVSAPLFLAVNNMISSHLGLVRSKVRSSESESSRPKI